MVCSKWSRANHANPAAGAWLQQWRLYLPELSQALRCQAFLAHLPDLQVVHQLRELFGARVTYLVNHEAGGFGEANTQGIQAATGEFVVLVNNDM